MLTEDLNFFYRLNKELERLQIKFEVLNIRTKIPDIPNSIILTTLKEIKKNGVKIKIITTVTPDSIDNVKALMDLAEIRHSPDIHAKFYLIDSSEVLFHMIPEDQIHPTYDTAIWVQAPLFATALADLFEHAWIKFEHAQKVMQSVAKSKK